MDENEKYLSDKVRATIRDAEELASNVTAAEDANAADPEFQQEQIRQSNVIYGGLMAVGLVMIQPFLTAPSLDISAMVCVISFAVSTPLLAALILVNRHETFRRQATPSRFVLVAKSIAQTAAVVGLAAGFWHLSWIAGVVLIASALLGVGVQSSGYMKLEYDSKFRRRKDLEES